VMILFFSNIFVCRVKVEYVQLLMEIYCGHSLEVVHCQ